MFKGLKKFLSGFSRGFKAYVAAVLVGVATIASSQAEMTLPDTGVDVAELIGLAITAMGAIAAAAICGYAAFLLVKKAVKWLSTSLG